MMEMNGRYVNNGRYRDIKMPYYIMLPVAAAAAAARQTTLSITF